MAQLSNEAREMRLCIVYESFITSVPGYLTWFAEELWGRVLGSTAMEIKLHPHFIELSNVIHEPMQRWFVSFYLGLTSTRMSRVVGVAIVQGRLIIEMDSLDWEVLTIDTLYLTYISQSIHYRGGFRRTGASSWHNIILGSVVGAISGYYIFAAPLKDYWEDQRQKPHTEMGSKIAAAGKNSK